jgi:hypothetical protein
MMKSAFSPRNTCASSYAFNSIWCGIERSLRAESGIQRFTSRCSQSSSTLGNSCGCGSSAYWCGPNTAGSYDAAWRSIVRQKGDKPWSLASVTACRMSSTP